MGEQMPVDAATTSIIPPTRSESERAQARAKAVLARRARARIKDRVRDGALNLTDVLDLARTEDERGRAAARLRVGEVLLCLPGVGPAVADHLLVASGISGQRRVRGIGVRQRERLLAQLHLFEGRRG